MIPPSLKSIRVNDVSVTKVKKLAQGGQAKIYLCKDNRSGAKCVLKKTAPKSQSEMDVAQREVALVKQMKHPNVVGYIADDISMRVKGGKTGYVVFLLMEYCPGGTLLEFANKREVDGIPMDEGEILRTFLQMARSVEYLHRHSPPVAHRDIKLENFLLGASGRLVLCDFGSCSVSQTRCETREERLDQESQIEQFTTPMYRAPELCDLYSGQLISEKVDIWALGCILFALAFRRHPFEEGGKLSILSGRIPFPSKHRYSKHFVKVVSWLLTFNAEMRPQIGDAVDFVEELLMCRKGPTSVERKCGTGARPPEGKKEDASGAVSDGPLHSQLNSSMAITAKSKKSSDLARQRLARRQPLTSEPLVATKPSPIVKSHSKEDPDLLGLFPVSSATFDPFVGVGSVETKQPTDHSASQQSVSPPILLPLQPSVANQYAPLMPLQQPLPSHSRPCFAVAPSYEFNSAPSINFDFAQKRYLDPAQTMVGGALHPSQQELHSTTFTGNHGPYVLNQGNHGGDRMT